MVCGRISQKTYWTLAEDPDCWKGKKSSNNYRIKEKNEQVAWDGTCTAGQETWKKKCSRTLGSPHQWRTLVKKWSQNLRGECSSRSQQPEKRKNPKMMISAANMHSLAWHSIHWCCQELDAGTRVSEIRNKERRVRCVGDRLGGGGGGDAGIQCNVAGGGWKKPEGL